MFLMYDQKKVMLCNQYAETSGKKTTSVNYIIARISSYDIIYIS